MKKLPTLTFIALSSLLSAQSIELVKQNGHSAIDIVFDNDSTHPKLSVLSYTLCPTPSGGGNTWLSAQVKAWVTNTGNQIVNDVYFVFNENLTFSAEYSDSINLQPGDTVLLSTTIIPEYQAFSNKLKIYSGNQLLAIDSIRSTTTGMDSGAISLNFGPPENYFGTPHLGDDGGAVAMLMPVDQLAELRKVRIALGPNTLPGGDIAIALFKPSSFDSTHIYPFNHIGYGSAIIGPSAISEGFIDIDWPLHFMPNPSGDIKYYYLVVYLYSNSGYNTIEIGNNTMINQPDSALMYYNTRTGIWRNTSDTSNFIHSPVIDIFTWTIHWDPCKPIGLNEEALNEFELFPQPSQDQVKVKWPDNWPQQEVHLFVYDMQGKELISKIQNTNEVVDVSGLNKGLYFLKLESEKGESFKKPLLIE